MGVVLKKEAGEVVIKNLEEEELEEGIQGIEALQWVMGIRDSGEGE